MPTFNVRSKKPEEGLEIERGNLVGGGTTAITGGGLGFPSNAVRPRRTTCLEKPLPRPRVSII